ncbi:MAG: hypothetical protein IJU84_04730, partial [Clostridia bacterium]|nr:hypothetical protein [Clostridia bacterium]
MYKKVRKTLLIVFTTVLLSVITAFSLAVVFAYYSNLPRVYTDDNTSEIARIGMRINLLFDRLNPDDFTNGTTITYAEGRTGEFDNTKPWGSKDNPYIISLPRHMLNLYALQTSGYFYDRYIKNNYDNNDNYKENSQEVPYFLVCGTDGTPIAIDGKRNGSNIEIKPIGNEQYPFIGVVGGAQVAGNAEAPNGYESKSSVIANFTVAVTGDDQTDVGLFGKIGYLGDETNV